MAETAPLRVQLIAKTEFTAPESVLWSTDVDGGGQPSKPGPLAAPTAAAFLPRAFR